MITVAIKSNKDHDGELKTPTVLIQPTNIRWNDFGYNFHATISLILEIGRPVLEIPALVVPIKSFDGTSVDIFSNLDNWIQNELIKSEKDYINPKFDLNTSGNFPHFITLLQGETAYRDLAAFVPEQTARAEILSELNDLVWFRASQIHDTFTNSLMLAEQFKLGVMRTGSAFRALHRGRRYIWGNYAPQLIDDSRNTFSFQCALQGFQGTPHSLTVKFIDNEVLSDRIHCLIGRNGTGKSRLLHELILTMGKSATAQENSTPFLDNFSSTARGDKTIYHGEKYTRVIAISSDGESSFPSAVRSDSNFEYYLANLHRTDIKEGGTNIYTRLLIDLMRGSDDIGERTRWQIFQASLKGNIAFSDLHIPLLDDTSNIRAIKVNETKWISAEELKSIGERASLELYAMLDLSREVCFIREGQEVRPSSGERMYFRFALNILSYIDTASVLIIDEPETHLHPNLICDFMNLLYEVLATTKSIALIATHSAYIVREVPSHCAHIYSIDEDRVPSEKSVYLKTLGASVESISQAIFSDSNAKKFHQQIVRSMAAEGRTIEELIDTYSHFVSPEMLSQVANLLNNKISGEDIK